MINHPRIVLNMIPFSELEIFLKNLYSNNTKGESLYDFIKNYPVEYREKIKRLLDAYRIYEDETDYTDIIFNRPDVNTVIYRHMRYFPSEVHKHNFFELIYILYGSCTVETDINDLILKEEDLLFLPPNMEHCTKVTDESIAVSILIHKKFFTNIFNGFLTDHNIMSSFISQGLYDVSEKTYILFHTYGDDNIKNFLETIIVENLINGLYSNLLIDSLLSTSINFLIRNHMDKAECGITKIDSMRLMTEIRLYIQNNLKTATLNNAAANFNYSAAYLSRLIKNKTSVTFSEILRNERIAKACLLLVNTDMSIEQISLAVGYATHRQFNRVFKEIVAMSPTKYRQLNNSSNNKYRTV